MTWMPNNQQLQVELKLLRRRGDNPRNGTECLTMLWTGAQTAQGLQMLRSAISLVLREAIARILLIQFHHQMVTMRLRDDACRLQQYV